MQEHPEVSVGSLCELFGVSRSWYYDKLSIAEKIQRDVKLRHACERPSEGPLPEFLGYCYRRVTEQLHREEWDLNHKRVLREHQPPCGFIHHSDPGVQYASGEYVKTLESAGARISMSEKGSHL